MTDYVGTHMKSPDISRTRKEIDMGLEEIKEHMQNIPEVANLIEEFDDKVSLEWYLAWLDIDFLEDFEQEEGSFNLIASAICKNGAFLKEMLARDQEYYGRLLGLLQQPTTKIPREEVFPIMRQYISWVEDEVEEIELCLEKFNKKQILGERQRKELFEKCNLLCEEMLPFGQEFQEAKQKKAKLKEKVGNFLNGKTITKAKTGIALLRKEIQTSSRRIKKLKNKKEKEAQEEREALEKRVARAEVLIRKLQEAKEAKRIYERSVEMSQAGYDSLDTQVQKLNEGVLHKLKPIVANLREIEKQIGEKMKEVEKFIEAIPEVYDELEEKTRVANQLNEVEERRIEISRNEVAECERRCEELERKHYETAKELAYLDAKYNAIREAAEESLAAQETLILRKDAALEELKWLKKLKKIDKALNVYCSAMGISFGLFLAVGKLAAGEGKPSVVTIIKQSAIKQSAMIRASSAIPTTEAWNTVSFAGGILAEDLVGTQIHAYDTGSFGISLKLGIAYGLDVGGTVGADVGVAVSYDASISVGDDRRFRVVHTIALLVTGEVSIPAIFEAAVEVELIKYKTGHVFKDVYQWAAWISQKWSNIKAWWKASTHLYEENRYSQPTQKDIERLREVAHVTMLNDPQLRDIFDKICHYMSEPVVLMRSKELLSGIDAGVSAAEIIGAGFTWNKTEEPVFYKRVYDEKTGEVHEFKKKGEQKRVSVYAEALQCSVAIAYDNIKINPNPDNLGVYLTFSVSISLLNKKNQWIKMEEEDVPTKKSGFSDWIEDHLGGLQKSFQDNTEGFLNSLETTFGQNSSKFVDLCTTYSFANCDIALVREPKEKKWLLLYIRPVFCKETELSCKIPIGCSGLSLELGGNISLTRTYREHLGTNTLGYVRTVYHGFMNITPPDRKDDPRPIEGKGSTLWDGWAKAHQKELWKIFGKVANDKAKQLGITKEIDGLSGGKDFITAVQKSPEIFKLKVAKTASGTFEKYLKCFVQFLEAARKDYLREGQEGWESEKAIPLSRFNWSINPYTISKEVRANPLRYKLQKTALSELGMRKGLKEQLHLSQVKWVTDESRPTCHRCGVKFTISTRRHHCRMCGEVFCAKCCPKQISHQKDLERVCLDCIEKSSEERNLQAPQGNVGNLQAPKTIIQQQRKVESPQRKKSVIQQQGTVVVPVGFTMIDVLGDGNCLFRSIAVAVANYDETAAYDETTDARHRLYRQMAVSHMRENSNDFMDAGLERSEPLDTYLNRMSHDGQWGGEPELLALSRALRREIVIHNTDSSIPISIQETREDHRRFMPLDDPEHSPIHILRISLREHYVCLRPTN